MVLALAGGFLILCCACLGRVVWRCYGPGLPLPILVAFPGWAFPQLGWDGLGGDSNAVDLTAVTVVAPRTPRDARVSIPDTSTPLHTAGCHDLMPGSPLSPVSSDRSYKSALGEISDESALAANPAAAPTNEDRVSLGKGIAEALLEDLLEAALNASIQPLIGEAPSGSYRTWYPRQAKTSRRPLYRHPENPYSRF